MIKFRICFFIFFIFLFSSIYSCSKIRESAGVTRKAPDEYKAVENPPLIIPPDFTLVAPDKLEQKINNNTDNDLAKEILFGLEDTNISEETQLSLMDQILSESNAINMSETFNEEFDKNFSNEISSKGILQQEWKDEGEVFDAVKQSEMSRDNRFNKESNVNDSNLINKEKVKKKKKKRFIFF